MSETRPVHPAIQGQGGNGALKAHGPSSLRPGYRKTPSSPGSAPRKSGGPGTILLVEDDPTIARALGAALGAAGLETDHVDTGAGAVGRLARTDVPAPAVILLDLRLPDMHGLEVMETIRTLTPQPATVVITGESSIDTAISAMRAGAVDFIPKPFNPARVITAVMHALDAGAVKREMESIHADHQRTGLAGLVGASAKMQAVYRMIGKVAPSKASVFITGESGTGKDVVAEAIHGASERSGRPFVALNCGAIPKDLMESELFGHVKGAFTGATADRPGAARQAHGGTLFLDELGEMDINLQSKLLRFIQTGDVQAVGASERSSVDVRFICATNRNPEDAVAQGRLREDLYYRLNVVPLHLPPLKDREGDAVLIARQFLTQFAAEEGKHFSGFDPEVLRLLEAHDWPGNVRELQNVIRRIVVLHEGPTVSADMLPEAVRREPGCTSVSALRQAAHALRHGRLPPSMPPSMPPSLPPSMPIGAYDPGPDEGIKPLWLVERETIERAITLCNGNVVSAAAQLEINPSTIYRKRQAWAKLTDAAE